MHELPFLINGAADLLEQIAAQLRQQPDRRNWIEKFRHCDVLPLSRAAEIAASAPETIRRWCVVAEYTDHPLGYLVGGLWLVDMPELFRQLEARRGERARLAAQARLQTFREQQSTKLFGRVTA